MKAQLPFILVLIIIFSTNIVIAQQEHMDVEGHVKIRGNIDINHMDDTTSVYIGRNAGVNAPSFGTYSTFVGSNTGMNSYGEENSFFGQNAGYSNTNGEHNSFFGQRTGFMNIGGRDNSFFGSVAGYQNNGNQNSFFGSRTGLSNTTGSHNSFFGQGAGNHNTAGSRNSFFGEKAGQATNPDTLDRAIAIGFKAKVDCSNCAVIGGTGVDAVNVGIGTRVPGVRLDVADIIRAGGSNYPSAGRGLELVYDTLDHLGLIQTYDRDKGMWGKLYLGGGNVGIGTTSPNYQLELSTAEAAKPGGGSWVNSTSDRRLKRDIRPYQDGLNEVLKIDPVWYRYIDEYNLPIDRSFVGIIAQDMQKIAPYTVGSSERKDGRGRENKFLNFDDNALTYMLINAVQDQQEIIENQQKEIQDLKEMFRDLKAQGLEIEAVEREMAELKMLFQEKAD